MVPDRLLDWPQLAKLVPYSRQHIGRLERAGQFPRRVQVGALRVAWRESEVQDWIRSRQSCPLPSGAGSAATLAAREGE
jgi:prophage regulatory protein